MIDAAFFTKNREKLLRQLPDEGVVWMTAYTTVQLSGDTAAPFRQEANFWYITGIDEPDWQLVMTREKTWLIAPYISEAHQVFDGSLSDSDALERSGADEVVSIQMAKELLVTLSARYDTVYTLGGDPHAAYYSFSLNPAPAQLERRLKRVFKNVQDVRLQLARLRAIKQPEEIVAIEGAIELTVTAFQRAKKALPSLRHEYELEAEFTAYFRRHNAHHAYDPIVASGINACTLHYGKNEMTWLDSSLVLIDIGARSNGYAADLTRTYAIGAPTQRQQAVYAAVKRSHQEIIALLRPGLTFEQYQEQSDSIVKEALRSLDLLKKEDDYRRYFPHAVSHGLGVEVHDSLGGWKAFKPGMIVTVEPGIYVPEDGIGVRLEDNILITEDGHRNMSEALSLEL